MKQGIDYKFAISKEIKYLFGVFAVDLETSNVKYSEYCEPYATGVYHPIILYECFKGDLNKKELAMAGAKVHVFEKNNNPVLEMIDFFVHNYRGNPEKHNKYGNRILSSYKYQMVGHNVSGFDNYIVLKSLPSSYKCIKVMKTSRRI